MILFQDTTLERYGIVESQSGVYGETIQSYEYIDKIQCDLQPETNAEIAHSYGEELSDLYKIYMDSSVTIDDHDLLIDTQGNKYDILGGVKTYNKFHHYKKAILKRRRDP